MSKLNVIVGLGQTGLSCARFFNKRNQAIHFFDTRSELENLKEIQQQFPDVAISLGSPPDIRFTEVEQIVLSPGVPVTNPWVAKAKVNGVPIVGDIELFARQVKQPVIAITGTNGKTTVTTLVGEMLQQAGIKTAVAGNIGTPVLDLLDDGADYQVWVLELSSFQLETLSSLSPVAATILNISKDHIDRYGSLASYAKAKQRIYQNATHCVYNREDELTKPENKKNGLSFGLSEPDGLDWGLKRIQESQYLVHGLDCVIDTNEVKIKGGHNLMNVLAACALVDCAGIAAEKWLPAVKTFAGLEHRCQWVRLFEGVNWYNDSKGTNVGATISAIQGIGAQMQGKIVLIAGGQGKGADFEQLNGVLQENVRAVVLIGEDAPQLEAAIDGTIPSSHADSMEDAVHKANKLANPGDVVLLSPACASFDMYRGYAHRGSMFTQAVNNL